MSKHTNTATNDKFWVIDSDGTRRKLLGFLPVLASGEAVGAGWCGPVFVIDADIGVVECDVDLSGERPTAGWMQADPACNVWREYDIGDCFSSRELAEKAQRMPQ
jgi:hypothetical protein